MGWNSWNVFGADIDDKKIRRMADRMVELGLVNYGYAYINIDDGWQGARGGKYNAIDVYKRQTQATRCQHKSRACCVIQLKWETVSVSIKVC